MNRKTAFLSFGLTGLQHRIVETTDTVDPAGGWAMKRYFFDLGNEGRSMYDFKGREFATPEAAYQLAELIALDLEVDEDWAGWAVAVCSVEGENVFSIPVREPDLIDW